MLAHRGEGIEKKGNFSSENSWFGSEIVIILKTSQRLTSQKWTQIYFFSDNAPSCSYYYGLGGCLRMNYDNWQCVRLPLVYNSCESHRWLLGLVFLRAYSQLTLSTFNSQKSGMSGNTKETCKTFIAPPSPAANLKLFLTRLTKSKKGQDNKMMSKYCLNKNWLKINDQA